MEKNICKEPGCRNYGKYCRIHLNAKVTAPAPIAKESKERATINRKEYAPKADAFKKANPVCQANINIDGSKCTGKTQHVHHMKGKNSKEDLLDESCWLAVCFNCHRVLEENPSWAKQNGFSMSRHAKKAAA